MINSFILENLNESEINVVLMHVASLKRRGYGEIVVKAENYKFTSIKDIFSENPATFKTLYAGIDEKR